MRAAHAHFCLYALLLLTRFWRRANQFSARKQRGGASGLRTRLPRKRRCRARLRRDGTVPPLQQNAVAAAYTLRPPRLALFRYASRQHGNIRRRFWRSITSSDDALRHRCLPQHRLLPPPTADVTCLAVHDAAAVSDISTSTAWRYAFPSRASRLRTSGFPS